jgi:hypothetical protein
MALTSAVLTSAKVEEWSDTQGNKFKGEPSEALGPIAVFRTSSGGGRRVPWRALSAADCVRFHELAAKRPARAEDWSKTTSTLAFDLIDRVKTRQGDELVKASLAGRPEPLLIFAFFVDNSEGKSWNLLGQSVSPFQELAQKYPGQIEGVQYGLNHKKEEHNNMALHMKVPWLVVDHSEQFRIQLLKDFAPRPGEFSLVVFTRHGVPLFSADNPGPDDIRRLFSDAGALLDLLRPDNARTWADRAYYLTAVQPVIHRNDVAGPVLVGDPLVPQGLRDRRIRRVEASIEVGADGKATAASLKDDGAIPAALRPALAEALKSNTLFVPAVDHGKFVPGSYAYVLEIGP